jgi:hypothetical protein
MSDLANEEMVNGYLDGRDPTSPEPSANRSWSYRHSFAVGRAEIEKLPILASVSRRSATAAEIKDASA